MSILRSSRSQYSSLFVLLFALSGCGGGGSSADELSVQPETDDTPEVVVVVESALAMAAPLSPLIRSGFGAGVTGMPVSDIIHFGGADESSLAPNNWQQLLVTSEERVSGYFEIQYQGGDSSQRYARLSPDPDDASNQALLFRLQEANVHLGDPDTGWYEVRGRVQANLYDNPDLKSYYQTVRMRLGPDFAAMEQYEGSFDWLTLFEAWNGANWIAGEQHSFHIGVDLTKPVAAAGSSLHLKAQGRTYTQDDGFVDIWTDTNTDFEVPLETWMTLELYIRQGDEQDGRFYMTVMPDGGEKKVLFDIADYTHSPDDPEPAGFDYINPMKLYTLGPVLEIVSTTGGVMEVHWDDLEFGFTAE